MQPLKNIDTFLKRFNNFKDGEFRSIEVISPTSINITLAGQDESRAFDWISLKLEFTAVSDAKLLDASKLSLIDMNDGISIIKNNNTIAFALSECYNISSIKTSSIYIESLNVKYEEGLF